MKSVKHAAAGVLLLAGLCIGPPLGAHDPEKHIVPETRVELEFGRTEAYNYDPPVPGSYSLPAIKKAGDGKVLDSQGRPHRLHSLLEGKLTVLAFIYTRCTDPHGCPVSMSLLHDLAYVGEEDPAIGGSLNLLALSFDPGYDTPELLAEKAALTESKLGYLTTASAADLKPILKAYDQPVGRKADADDPLGPLTHQLRVFLIDRRGLVRNIYSLGFLDPRLVVTDIRTLLLEESGDAPEG